MFGVVYGGASSDVGMCMCYDGMERYCGVLAFWRY